MTSFSSRATPVRARVLSHINAVTGTTTALAAALFVLTSQSALAQSTKSSGDSSAPTMETVIVTGVTAKTEKLDAAFSINTIDVGQIEQLSPMSTADLLGNIPGFFAEGSTAGEASNNITVRGLPVTGGFRYAPQLIDGLPVYQEPDMPFMNNDVFIRSDLMTDRVEVVKGGPGGILYSNGLGATVNYVTKTGGDEFHGAAKVEWADYGFIRTEAYESGPINKNTTFAIGGFYRVSQGIRNTGYTADNGGQIRGNVVWTSDDGTTKVSVYGTYIDDRTAFYQNLPIEVPGFSSPGTATNPIYIHSATVQPIGLNLSSGTTSSPETRYIYQLGEYGSRTVDMADGIHPKFSTVTAIIEKTLPGGWNVKLSARDTRGTSGFNALFTGNDAASASTFLSNRWTNDVLQTAFDSQWQQDFAGTSHRSNILNQYFNPLSNSAFVTNYENPILASGFANFNQVRAQWGADYGKGVGVQGYYTDNGQPITSNEKLTFLIPWVVQTRAFSDVQDLQIQKSFDFFGSHSLTVGGYHSNYHDDYNFQQTLAVSTLSKPVRLVDLKVVDANGNQVGAPLSIKGSFLPGFSGNVVSGKFDGYASYAEDHWETFDHRLKVDLGVRWETENADVKFQNRVCCSSQAEYGDTNYSPALDQLDYPGTPQTLNHNYHGLGWSVGANWSFARELAVYGLVSRSFRLPSFNDAIGFAQSAPLGDAVEHIMQYETGARYQSSQLDASVALYYNRFQPRQQTNTYQDITAAACGSNPTNISTCPFVSENFSYGIKNVGTEIELAYRPDYLEGLELRTNLVIQDPRVMGSSFHSVQAVTDIATNVTTGYETITVSQDGRRPGRLARYNVNFMPSWDLNPLTKLPVKLYAQYTFFSSRYSNANDVNVTVYPSYYILNGGALWDVSDNLSFQLHVSNITNQLTFTEGDPLYFDLKAPDGTGNRGVARPLFGRTFRAFMTYRW